MLLSFLKQTVGGEGNDPKVYKRLVRQVFGHTGKGFDVAIAIQKTDLDSWLYRYGLVLLPASSSALS